jgi:hypothetical protein
MDVGRIVVLVHLCFGSKKLVGWDTNKWAWGNLLMWSIILWPVALMLRVIAR